MTRTRRRPARPRTDAAAAVATASDRGARVVAVVIALAWHLAIGLPAVVASRAELAGRAWCCAAGPPSRRPGRRPGRGCCAASRCPRWPLAVLLLAVDALVFAAAGASQLFAAANWVWGTLGWFFVLVLWGRRVAGWWCCSPRTR